MKCVFIFSSIHQVMRAEKLLKGKGIKIDLIPVPREISSDCGVAIELSADSEKEAFLLLQENKVSILECYARGPEGRFERKIGIKI
jgi:hypothetical protein